MSSTSPHMGNEHTSLRAILFTGASLLVLWAVSWALSTAALGPFGIVVALTIAVIKATLVALFFMELAFERLSIKLTLLAAGSLAAILGAFMVTDVLTR